MWGGRLNIWFFWFIYRYVLTSSLEVDVYTEVLGEFLSESEISCQEASAVGISKFSPWTIGLIDHGTFGYKMLLLFFEVRLVAFVKQK